MEFEELNVKELREAARHFAPESRGAGGIAHCGSKEELITLLRGKGVMACEAKEYCDGNGKVEVPKDVPVIPVGKAGQGGADDAEDNGVVDAEIVEDGGQSKNEGELPLIPREQPQPEPQPQTPKGDDSDELEILRQIITRKVKQGGVDTEAVGKIVDE